MEEIIKRLLSKISYNFLIVIICGIYLPGIFVLGASRWDIFLALDIFKLSVLAVLIAFPSFLILFCVIGFLGMVGCISKRIKPEVMGNEIVSLTILGNWMVASCYLNSIGIDFYGVVKKIFCIAVLVGVLFGLVVFLDSLFKKE